MLRNETDPRHGHFDLVVFASLTTPSVGAASVGVAATGGVATTGDVIGSATIGAGLGAAVSSGVAVAGATAVPDVSDGVWANAAGQQMLATREARTATCPPVRNKTGQRMSFKPFSIAWQTMVRARVTLQAHDKTSGHSRSRRCTRVFWPAQADVSVA